MAGHRRLTSNARDRYDTGNDGRGDRHVFRDSCKLTLLIGLVAGTPGVAAAFGPGEAARHVSSHCRRTGEQKIDHADFKVVFWYRRADPLATFKYQVYDVRKGEYTPAVEAWIQNVQSKYPAYTAFTRDVDLSIEKGRPNRSRLDRSSSANSRWRPPFPGSSSAVRSTAAAGHSNRYRVSGATG